MKNSMASSGLWENVILIKIILTIDSTMLWYLTIGAEPHTDLGDTHHGCPQCIFL